MTTFVARLLVMQAFAALALATSANAQTRAPYQEYVFANHCGSDTSNTCRLTFRAVPAASRLEISNVSCHIHRHDDQVAVHSILVAQLIVLARNGDAVSAVTLVPVRVGAGHATYAANHTVRVFANARQIFQAFVQQSANATFPMVACHISGDMVTLP